MPGVFSRSVSGRAPRGRSSRGHALGLAVPYIAAFVAVVLLLLPTLPMPAPTSFERPPGSGSQATFAGGNTTGTALQGTEGRPATNGESTLSILPHDPADFPNQGLEMNVSGFASQSLGPLTSFQVAAEETVGGYDAVFGLFENYSFGPIGFFEVFTSATDQTVHLAYGAPLATVPQVGYQFRLTVTLGTVWALTVNGEPFGANANASSFDFGVSYSTNPTGLGFSEVAFYQGTPTAVVPDLLVATTALAVREGSSWHLPNNATVTYSGPAAGEWGVEGRDQVASLAPGELRSGTSIPTLANGTPVWSGGPVPVEIAFSLASVTTTATLPILARASVHDGTGSPIAGVPLAISDSRGGLAIGGGNVTDPQGFSELELLTPNVSAPRTDLVTVASTILGYAGSTSESLILTPPVQILLSASPNDPTVPINGSVSFTIRTSLQGSVAPLTTIQFSSTFGGSLSVAYGQSDSRGMLAIAFRAGESPSVVSIHAVVYEPGAWGGLTFNVHIVRPTPDPWTRAEPFVAVAAAGALVALAVVVVLRRKAQPLPELVFLPKDREVDPAPGPTPDPPAPLSRTPPSEGNP
ncbi:MAG: hypothetical protein L3J95_06495 [Thermoplasmata archaeon]|nr:hypothetical protein [Thermoplasmata archaeon]